jgi:hypothetical protein
MQSSSLFINLVEKVAKPTNIFIIGLYLLSFTISIGFITAIFQFSWISFQVMGVLTVITYIFWLFALMIRHVINDFVY